MAARAPHYLEDSILHNTEYASKICITLGQHWSDIAVMCHNEAITLRQYAVLIRNSLCGKINSVLCYFCERDALVKLKLLRSYCSDFYGSVLWDLSHSYVEDVCIAWRRGLGSFSPYPFCTDCSSLWSFAAES